MKAVALNTDILATSSFQFSKQLFQTVEVYRLTYFQLEEKNKNAMLCSQSPSYWI